VRGEILVQWLRRADAVLIVDAKPDNFMKTSNCVTPIDLQMWKAQLQELPPAPESSLIIAPLK